MPLGPVEYILISFPGNRFTGRIAPALADLVEQGTVRILDLVFVSKDADGNVTSLEYDELDDDLGYGDLDGEAELMSDEDLVLAAEVLEPNSSALLILWEDCWATPLAEAIRAAGGELVTGGRIPHDELVAALAGIED